jgi:hypothetical protein
MYEKAGNRNAVAAVQAVMLVCAACLSGACSDSIEATFKLAPASKLPAWFAVPLGMARDELSVTLDVYTQAHATARLMDRKGHVLAKFSGPATEPMTNSGSAWGVAQVTYPSYDVITMNGIAQVIEHRRQEPIFYVTDDATIANRLIDQTAH